MLLTAEETSPRSDTSAPKESSDLIEALKAGIAYTKTTQKQGTPSDLRVWVGRDEVAASVAASSWRDVTCGIAEALLILDKRPVLEETRLVNKHLDERTKDDGSIYPPHAYRKLSDGTYLFLHAGAVAHSKRCKKMLNLINAPAQVIRIIYKGEEFYLP